MSAINTIDRQAANAIAQVVNNGAYQGKIAFIQRSDAMAPEIPIGAVVIVDTSINWYAKSGGLYLLNIAADPARSIAQHQTIKRLTKHDLGPRRYEEEDLYSVSCANQYYRPYDAHGDELDIAGMVVGSVQCFSHC